MGLIKKISRSKTSKNNTTTIDPVTSSITLEKPVTKIKRTKKVFDKLGQTKQTPPETDSLRCFYTTLLQQKPSSQMALKWCLEHGLLEEKKTQEAILVLGINKLKV